MVYLISGSGSGAGKTTLAERLVGASVYSIASALRRDLKCQYPQYDWYNKTQQYTDVTRVIEYDNLTVRDVLVDYGQKASRDSNTYWVDKLIKHLHNGVGKSVIAIDDVRKIEELDKLKYYFPVSYHFHVDYPLAKSEPLFDNEQLKQRADYIVQRRD